MNDNNTSSQGTAESHRVGWLTAEDLLDHYMATTIHDNLVHSHSRRSYSSSAKLIPCIIILDGNIDYKSFCRPSY